MNLVKKISIFALTLATVITTSGFQASSVKAAGNYGDGSLLAKAGEAGAAVYVIRDGKKVVFPDSKTYFTWYENFDTVVKVSVAELDMYPEGGVVPVRPGTKLVTHVNTAKVYAVEPGGTTRHIPSAEVAASLYGANWASRVMDVIPGYFSSYTEGSALSNTLPTGTLVKDGSTYYYIDNGTKRAFASMDAFEANNFNLNYVINASLSSYTAGTSITGAEDALKGITTVSNNGGGNQTSGSVTVSLASDTPAAGIAYKNATHVPFTKVRLTAGSQAATIDSLVIERTGVPASDTVFSGANVMKDGTLLSASYKAFNSDHEATFTEDIVVPANTSVYITLVGKMADFAPTYQGEMPKLSLKSVNLLGGGSVSGSLPVVGNAMATNASITIGTLAVSENPHLSGSTEEVGSTDVEFLNVKLDNDSSSADMRIDSIRFNNVGTADDADVANMELVVDGNVIATSNMSGDYVTFNLSSCGSVCLIDNGKNETFQLRGDIVGGSARTLDFDIKKADDIMAYDTLNGTYVTPSAAIDGANTIDISRGTLNISKTNTVQASNIAEDTNDLELGSWNFKVQGEPITINTLSLSIDVTGTVTAADFTNLKLVDENGRTLTGSVDGVGSADGFATSTDSFTLPEGDNEITLVGNLNSDAVNNDTVKFAIDLSYTASLDATGDTTGDDITVGSYAFPQGTIYGNLLTVKDLSMSATSLSNPAAQTIAAGKTDHLYSTIRFDATDSSEDVKVTNFQFEIEASATAKTNELQNITFVVGDKTLSVTKNGTRSDADGDNDEEISVSLSGTDQFIVSKGSAVNMLVYADLSAGAAQGGTHRIDISSANTNVVTAQGATSGNSVDVAEGSARANAMTVGAAGGQVEVTLDANNPNAALMASGAEVELAKFKFYATSTEDVEIDYLYLTQVVTDAASSSYLDYDYIWFENEAGTEIAGTRMSPTSTKPKIDFGNDAFVVGSTDTDGAVLTLKAQLATIGTGYNGTAGHYVGYKINAAADVVAKGDLTGSASYEYLSGTVAGNTHYMYKGYPVFARTNLTNNLTNGTNDLFKFTVSAVNNDIALYGFTFDVATTGVDVTNFYLYDVTGTEKQINDTAGNPTVTGFVWQTVGSDWTTNYASREVTVAKNATRTFLVRANVTGASSGDSVSVKMAGDNAHLAGATLMATAANVYADANNDFIWTDKSLGSHAYTTADWTNGYLVEGLPSTSSTAQVISL